MMDLVMNSEEIKKIISEIPDPEIPVITIADLGILRDIIFEGNKVVVSITPTYNGCPAMKAIEQEIISLLAANGIENVVVKTVYSPVWTTDWLSENAKEKLNAYGISPPHKTSHDKNSLTEKKIICPRCASMQTELISHFGSTACKALYRCTKCLEPFDYFKCH